jgi:hypothetical protein
LETLCFYCDEKFSSLLFFIENYWELGMVGMVLNVCDLPLGRLRQEDNRFQSSLGYMARPFLKNNY